MVKVLTTVNGWMGELEKINSYKAKGIKRLSVHSASVSEYKQWKGGCSNS